MKTEKELKLTNLHDVASRMVLAARTAPKTRGIDHVFGAVLEKTEIKQIADIMIQKGKDNNLHFFERDGYNLHKTDVLVLLGVEISPLNLPQCGFCGYTDCDEKRKHPETPCAFNTGDLGIALGSAVSVAMDHRVDNRIMFTSGKAALESGLLPDNIKIAYGIPLSAESKNPYFDRK